MPALGNPTPSLFDNPFVAGSFGPIVIDILTRQDPLPGTVLSPFDPSDETAALPAFAPDRPRPRIIPPSTGPTIPVDPDPDLENLFLVADRATAERVAAVVQRRRRENRHVCDELHRRGQVTTAERDRLVELFDLARGIPAAQTDRARDKQEAVAILRRQTREDPEASTAAVMLFSLHEALADGQPVSSDDAAAADLVVLGAEVQGAFYGSAAGLILGGPAGALAGAYAGFHAGHAAGEAFVQGVQDVFG